MKISVIIPCFNARGKIEACVSSLQAVDFSKEEFEVIFVDDFSSDGTYEYLKEICKNELNWSVYKLNRNSGSPSKPRNYGTKKALGLYILYLDCDDTVYPDTLRVHYEHALSKNACIVRGYLMVDDGDKELRSLNKISNWIEDSSKEEKIKLIISHQSTNPVSLIKKSVLIDNDIIWREDIRMGEDTIFLIEVMASSDVIVYIDHPTFVYNKRLSRQASSTQQYGRRELKDHLQVWNEAERLLSEFGVSYYHIRLHVGLDTALRAIIFYGRGDIDEPTFHDFSVFLRSVWDDINKSYFNPRLNEIIESILKVNYFNFIECCKPRLVLAGFDLKFILQSVTSLSKFFVIRIDEWSGHETHNVKHSRDLLQWADYIWCEWLLGNAVWYSQNKRHNQKLVVRMHRMELARNYGDQLNFDKVHAIVTVSILFFERALERFGRIKREKLRLVPNYTTVGPKDTRPECSRLFKLGAVGIVPRRKGFMRMLKILTELRKRDSRYSLDVFGHAPEHFSWITRDKREMEYYEDCYKFIEENGLAENVNFLGQSKLPEALTERKVGFVLSTSDKGDHFPGPESFHLAVLDGFSGGGQGIILRWDGCEYIYPPSIIMNTENDIVDYIFNISIDEFYKTSELGRNLIVSKYSEKNFVDAVVSIFKE
ncbi:glycosyltransferase [Brucella anthropi]|uniref:glycosyltransferase n=1 Tax=Brucella anthropi TaxID=529 RepID=UPI001F34D1D5|nr:glycosyltransferase [Brucella anthropi]